MPRMLLAFVIIAALAIGAYAAWKMMTSPMVDAAALYMTDDDRLMTIDGANVRVRIEGPEGAPAIVLMHGFVYSLESFDVWAAALKDDHRVIRFDLLGHGLSGPDPQKRYSPDERAAFVGSVMDVLGVDKAVIGGNSLGGLAAWKFAAAHPERTNGLILVSPGAFPANGVGDTALSPPPPMALFLRTGQETAVATALANIYYDKDFITDEKVKLVSTMMRQPGNGDAFVESIEKFTLRDPVPALNSITAPTLVLWGAQDRIIPLDQGKRIVEEIPGARLVVYDNIGHVAQEESAQSIIDVKAFLAEIGH